MTAANLPLFSIRAMPVWTQREDQVRAKGPTDLPPIVPKRRSLATTGSRMHITGYAHDAKDVCLYSIHVSKRNGSQYTIRRRFTDFKTLVGELQKDESILLPALPSYGVVWRLQSLVCRDELLLERVNQLQEILDVVDRHEHLWIHRAARQFIDRAPGTPGARGYVSLSRYESQTSLQVEILEAHARKRRHSCPEEVQNLYRSSLDFAPAS